MLNFSTIFSSFFRGGGSSEVMKNAKKGLKFKKLGVINLGLVLFSSFFLGGGG